MAHRPAGMAWAARGRARAPARPGWAGSTKAASAAWARRARTGEGGRREICRGTGLYRHVDDWRSLAPAWWATMPRVHEQYPHLLAEMYALTMSAANLTTPWSQLSSYMVSDPRTMSPTEAWAWIDDLATREGPGAVCAGATATTLPAATRGRARRAPIFLHFCQRARTRGVFFAKSGLPDRILRLPTEPLSSTFMRSSAASGALPSTTVRAGVHALPHHSDDEFIPSVVQTGRAF